MYMHPLIDREKMSPKEALDILIEGNQRFTKNLTAHRDLLSIVNITKDKQHPFVAILGCSDSRTSTEIVFDQSLGDVFSVRLAGNIASQFAIGSLEYSCKYLGSKLVVVLGHTGCGAVKAACDHFTGGNIGEIVKKIDPAVALEEQTTHLRDSNNESFVNNVCHHNVDYQLNAVLAGSDILSSMLEEKKIAVIAAVYDITTGVVTFDLDKSRF